MPLKNKVNVFFDQPENCRESTNKISSSYWEKLVFPCTIMSKLYLNVFLRPWLTRLTLHVFGKKVNVFLEKSENKYVNVFLRPWLTRLTLHAFGKECKRIFGPIRKLPWIISTNNFSASYWENPFVPHTLTKPYVNIFIRHWLTRLTLHAFRKKVIVFWKNQKINT